MKTSGIEEFKSVLRRSALLIIAAVLLGSVVVNVVRQLGGPKYRADAQVLLNNNNPSSAARGASPRLRAPMTEVVIPEECQSIPITEPNA